jgi:hypothetical protein
MTTSAVNWANPFGAQVDKNILAGRPVLPFAQFERIKFRKLAALISIVPLLLLPISFWFPWAMTTTVQPAGRLHVLPFTLAQL